MDYYRMDNDLPEDYDRYNTHDYNWEAEFADSPFYCHALYFYGYLERFDFISYSSTEDYLSDFKQELIAKVFHPERISHLIETYGIDSIDEL